MKTTVGKLLLAAVLGSTIAAIINVVVYVIAQYLNNGALLVTLPKTLEPQALTIFMVIIASVAPGVVAGLLYVLLKRFTNKARLVFLIIATVILLSSLLLPLSAASSWIVLWALELMHLITAIAIITAILR